MKSKDSNEYGKFLAMVFNFTGHFFRFFMGFGIAYIFAFVIHTPVAEVMLKIASVVAIPLIVLMFSLFAMAMIVESTRH